MPSASVVESHIFIQCLKTYNMYQNYFLCSTHTTTRVLLNQDMVTVVECVLYSAMSRSIALAA